jgi:hypothetical protein
MRSVEQYVADEQRAILGINRELERANALLHEANQKLHRVNESRLSLSRTVSHEVKNFANAIKGAIHLLRGEAEPRQRDEMIAVCRHNLDDITSLMDQLLGYSVLLAGQRTLHLETLAVGPLFDELLLPFGPLLEKAGMRLEMKVDPTLGEVASDRLALRQIVGNLLSNAIKYGRGDDGEPHIWLEAARDGSAGWKIIVADDGPGIAPEHREAIFREFYRGAHEGDVLGTGLGLSIAARLTHLLHGHISLESETGKGCRFEVTLPLSPPTPERML